MKSIFKYVLLIKETQLVTLPKNAQVLSVANQRGNLVLWAAVNTQVKETEQHLITIGTTGNPLPDIRKANFLGTVLFDNDTFVAHVFHEKI